jgi:hypothetical chaperone protein
MTQTLAIDFGTSNTAAAVMQDGVPKLIELEPGQTTFPTAIFLDFATRTTLFGTAAVQALIDGREGRFMRALKSVLGTPLMHEPRQLMNRRMTLIDVIAMILAEVKTRSEAACGCRFDHALSGRPVHFHTKDAARDARALADLTACYLAAGFQSVEFLAEPEAAARAHGDTSGKLGLIVDIGGGTSDFTVFEGTAGRQKVLASYGVRVGGTDFDKTLSLAHVMPLIGKDALLRAEIGPSTHTAPVALFNELASWEKIAFLYTGEARRKVAHMARFAVEKGRFSRLVDVLEMELGHDIAFCVEAGKIGANGAGGGRINLGVIEKGLDSWIAPADLLSDLGHYAAELRTAALETVQRANLSVDDIGTVVFVGGSSLMNVVRQTMAAVFPAADLAYSNAFTAVVDGLAIAAANQSEDR